MEIPTLNIELLNWFYIITTYNLITSQDEGENDRRNYFMYLQL